MAQFRRCHRRLLKEKESAELAPELTVTEQTPATFITITAPKSRNAGRRRVTIPKRLRIYSRFDRRLLGELCRAAAPTVITVYRAVSEQPDAVPGMVGAIQIPLCGTSLSIGIRIPEAGEHLIR